MDITLLLISIVIGAVAGWLAGVIMKGGGFGLLGNIVVGIIGGVVGGFLFRLPTTGSDQERFLKLRDAPDSPLVTLACARTLPANAEVKLVWGRGIAATTGVATSAARALAFKVRPTFRASFSCSRVNKDAQCMPILPLSLSFSAPIAKADA